MQTDVKKIKIICFVNVHPKAFHFNKLNAFLTFASYIEI